jgi:hypothetical protein
MKIIAKFRVLFLLILGLVAIALFTTSDSRASPSVSEGYVYLTQTSYQANESQGQLQITIARTDDSESEQIRYGVRHGSAIPGLDMDTVKNTTVTLQPGQSTYSFNVNIVDRGMNAPSVTATAYIYGSDPQALGDANGKIYAHGPVDSSITILRNDPLDVRNNSNILTYNQGAVADPNNPLRGVKLYSSGQSSPAGMAAKKFKKSHPSWYAPLNFLANEPSVQRYFLFGTVRYPASIVARQLETEQAQTPGQIFQLSTYSLVHGGNCGALTTTPAFAKRYDEWIRGLARGIGNFHVVMYLEVDSLITTRCMNPAHLAIRLAEIKDAINVLEQDPHVAVYIDGGAADALSWQRTATLLNRAGVHNAQGFFLNATHFDWTTKEVAYGQKIARKLRGVHFIVSTASNGRGPDVPLDRVSAGNEYTCNPPGVGLGPLSEETGYKYVDGFLWLGDQGNSSGNGPGCGKNAPPAATFWPSRAVNIVRRANFHVTGPKESLQHDGPYKPYNKSTSPNYQIK